MKLDALGFTNGTVLKSFNKARNVGLAMVISGVAILAITEHCWRHSCVFFINKVEDTSHAVGALYKVVKNTVK